ncbi:MAG TPA: hypothetical protein VE011_08815 [Candidatus Dormibacteraeota bacterium]|nr:hypothetical protein [Candidatus Dormibacteraeota bacterium]
MSPERLIALGGLVISIFLLSQLAPSAIRAWAIYSGVRSRRLADAGPLAIPPPDAVAQRVAELEALGFSRIGERFIQLPRTPIRYEWVLGEESGEAYVVIVPSTVIGTLIAFYTSFEDSTWVQTNFPRGAVVDRPTFHASFVTTSLTEALATHRAQVARLVAGHGHPRVIRTMADTLRMDADFRVHHGGLTLRPLIPRLIGPAIAALLLAILCAVLLVTGR